MTTTKMVHPNAENRYKEVEMLISNFNKELNDKFEPLGIVSYVTPDVTELLFKNQPEGLDKLRTKLIELEQSRVILPKEKEAIKIKWNRVFAFMNLTTKFLNVPHFNEMKPFFTFDVCKLGIKKKAKEVFMELETRDVQDHHLELERILTERYEIEQKLATFIRQHSSDLTPAFSRSTQFVAQPNNAYISFIEPLISNGRPDLTRIVFSGLHEKRWE